MIIFRLAEKKLNLIFGNAHERRERIFEEFYLEKWCTIIKNTSGLTLPQLFDYCSCCEKFGIQILGFETTYESIYGLYTFAFEEYSMNYFEEWWYSALADLKLNGITNSVIPYIHIPSEVLSNYLSNE